MNGSNDGPERGAICPDSRIAQRINRRRVVAGAGALAIGTVGLVGLGSEPVAAEVSVESLNVKDADFEGQQVDPVLDVQIAYEFDVVGASNVYLALKVGDTTISDMDVTTRSDQLEQTTDLSGRVVTSDQWATSDFAPPAGESVSRSLDVTLKLVVSTDDGEEVTATAEDTATIDVTNPATGMARIGGVGSFSDSN